MKAPFGQKRSVEEKDEMDWMTAMRQIVREENEKIEQKIISAMETRVSQV